MFLVNNLALVLITFTVLIGTTFPLIVEALRDKQMSVGRPYFDRMVVPNGLLLLFLLGVGPALPWARATAAQVRRALLPPLGGAAALALVGLAVGMRNPWTVLTMFLAGYALQVTLVEQWRPVVGRMRVSGEGFWRAAARVQLGVGRRRFAGYVVHVGMILVMVAVAVSSTMAVQKELQLAPGESAQVGSYKITFVRTEERQEPHRSAVVALVALSKGGQDLGTMEPRMNHYDTQREPVGTPDVRSFLFRDVYLSVLNIDPAGGKVGLLALDNPMVGWIWGATGLMALGGLLALFPRREGAAS